MLWLHHWFKHWTWGLYYQWQRFYTPLKNKSVNFTRAVNKMK